MKPKEILKRIYYGLKKQTSKITYLIIALFAISAGFTACKKPDEDENSTQTKLVKQFTVEDTIISFEYDSMKRLTKVRGWDDNDFFLFEYSTNAIIEREQKNGVISSSSTHILDNEGFITELEYYDSYGEVGSFRYVYNNGYLSKRINNRGGFLRDSIMYKWHNGNLIEENYYFNGTLEYYQLKFTYTNKENKMNIDYPYGFGGLINLIKPKGWASKNYIESECRYYYYSLYGGDEYGIDSSKTYYTYTFDNDGYPSQIKFRYVSPYHPDSYWTTPIIYY